MWARDDKRKKEDEFDIEPLTDEEISTITATAGQEDVVMTERLFDTEEEFFAHGKEIAKELDAQSYMNTPWVWMKNSEGPIGLVPKQEVTEDISPDELYDYIDEGRKDDVDIPVLEGEEMWAQTAIDTDTSKQDLDNAISLIAEMQAKLDVLQAEHDAKHVELEKIKAVDPVTLTDHLGNPIATYYPPVQQQVVAPDLSINAELDGNSVSAGFGTTFPKNPTKGDLYLRVDYLPSKLYKWNDIKWIEVDKTTTDVYSYDVEYIKHLTNKIASGEYDVDLLTPAEQEQIQQYIKNNTQ
jgi:hypothetical protein